MLVRLSVLRPWTATLRASQANLHLGWAAPQTTVKPGARSLRPRFAFGPPRSAARGSRGLRSLLSGARWLRPSYLGPPAPARQLPPTHPSSTGAAHPNTQIAPGPHRSGSAGAHNRANTPGAAASGKLGPRAAGKTPPSVVIWICRRFSAARGPRACPSCSRRPRRVGPARPQGLARCAPSARRGVGSRRICSAALDGHHHRGRSCVVAWRAQRPPQGHAGLRAPRMALKRSFRPRKGPATPPHDTN